MGRCDRDQRVLSAVRVYSVLRVLRLFSYSVMTWGDLPLP